MLLSVPMTDCEFSFNGTDFNFSLKSEICQMGKKSQFLPKPKKFEIFVSSSTNQKTNFFFLVPFFILVTATTR